MHTTIRRGGPLAALTMVGFLAAGCGGTGGALGDILGGVLGSPGQEGQLVAEVQSVDTRNGVIAVRTEDGRTGSVAYDANTRVVYQGRDYQPTALERGDVVVMRVQERQDGRLYTDHVEVRQSAQDRDGGGSLAQAAGTVQWVDHNNGRFGLRAADGRTITVSLAFNAPRATVDRFRTLREGERVTVEGEWLNQDRIEIQRFR